jgi:hypothetical protein
MEHVLDVSAGRKGLAGTGHNQDTDRFLGVNPLNGAFNIVDELRAGQFVTHIVPVQGQYCDTPLDA